MPYASIIIFLLEDIDSAVRDVTMLELLLRCFTLLLDAHYLLRYAIRLPPPMPHYYAAPYFFQHDNEHAMICHCQRLPAADAASCHYAAAIATPPPFRCQLFISCMLPRDGDTPTRHAAADISAMLFSCHYCRGCLPPPRPPARHFDYYADDIATTSLRIVDAALMLAVSLLLLRLRCAMLLPFHMSFFQALRLLARYAISPPCHYIHSGAIVTIIDYTPRALVYAIYYVDAFRYCWFMIIIMKHFNVMTTPPRYYYCRRFTDARFHSSRHFTASASLTIEYTT